MSQPEENQRFEEDLQAILKPNEGDNPAPENTKKQTSRYDWDQIKSDSKKKRKTAWVEILIRVVAALIALFLLLRFAVNIATR